MDIVLTDNEIRVNGQAGTPTTGGMSVSLIAGDMVIKLQGPYEELAYCQVSGEIVLWDMLEPDDRQYFARLIDWGRMDDGTIWSAKQYHELYEWQDLEEWQHHWEDIVRPLTHKYNIYDVTPYRNWGVDVGTEQPIIFDWGLRQEKDLYELQLAAA